MEDPIFIDKMVIAKLILLGNEMYGRSRIFINDVKL